MQRKVGRWAARIATALIIAQGAAVAETTWPPETVPPQINVTTDSSRGWLPSQAQISGVRKTTEDFLAEKDSGQTVAAYALLADINREHQALADFAAEASKFNQQAGAAIERRVTKITWTRDPADAPAPGVYAALDLTSTFANIHRHCGFLILYQPPDGGTFKVMREESNFLDDPAAKTIEQQHSQAELDKVWAQVSAHCPNYITAPAPLAEQPRSSIGYPTVEAVLADLRSRPGVVMSTNNGWTIAADSSNQTVWSFPPAGHPAYPSAVKRQVQNRAGGVYVSMNVLCEATKQACDDLVRSFKAMNEQMRHTPPSH